MMLACLLATAAADTNDEGHGHGALRRRCTCCALAPPSSNNVSMP